MRYILAALFCFVSASSFAYSQSGRRVKPTPTPVSVTKDDPAQYSESKPRALRIRVTDRPTVRNGDVNTTTITPPAAAETTTDPETLKIETNLITIPVSVYDRNGLYIPGLRRQDFKI